MPNDIKPTKAQRQADARARAAEMRRKQESAAKRNRIIAISFAAFVVLALVGTFTYVFINHRQTATTYSSVAWGGADADNANLVAPELTAVQAPSTANTSAGIPVSAAGVGKAGANDVVLQVYFDLQCPVCQQFDAVNSADLQAMAKEPGITVVYQPLSFLDHASQGTHYSNRAANALMTVADKDPTHFEAFITALYQQQPAENSTGLTDDKIASIAQGVGVPSSVTDTFTDTVSGSYQLKDSSGATTDKTGSWRTFAPFVAAATQYAGTQPVFPNGQIGTPAIVLDGKQIGAGGSDGVNWTQAGSLRSYVEAQAAAKKG
jgi:protein-disulfide isomerase